MIRLYLSDDLCKSAGAPPTGGGPKGVSVPKTPGAATGGSGPQIVDCPLGANCPDGGRHQMGSATLKEHTAQAQKTGQSGQSPIDESTGQPTEKPGVTPGTANIGGLGSDQVKRTPPPVDTIADVTEDDINTRPVGSGEIPAAGHDENAPDTRQTLREFPASADEDASNEGPGSQKKTLIDPVINLDEEKQRQNVPNPMVADEAQVPPDSKPMDHYKLARVARDSGDEDLAKFHEGMARKRTDGMGSEDHKKLSEQLHAEGMHDAAEYHSGIHQRVQEDSGNKASVPVMVTKDQHQQLADLGYSKEARNSMKPEEAHELLSGKKHEGAMRDVHSEARAKASKDLDAAKKQHEDTKAKADKIRALNEEKLKGYEEAKKKAEAAKAEGKKVKPPQKPKLEKEEKVPEKPELSEPADDAEKLRHEGHTNKAKRLADLAESHLKGNQNLSSGERQRLERAHNMAVYHSNIGYTPTAAHKKELGEVEQAISGMGIKQTHEEMASAEDAKRTATAAKQAEKDKAMSDKQQGKQQQAQEKEQQKLKAAAPKPPQTDLDHARVADHQGKARKLRENIESHMSQNPNMSPEDKAKSERILSELDKHENMTMIPGSDHQSELKELEKLSGEHGKQAYEPEDDSSGGDSGPSAVNMLRAGSAIGGGIAAAAASPRGQAGAITGQLINYGASGASAAGHRLLHDKDEAKNVQADLDKDKEAKAKQQKTPPPESGGNTQ